MWIRRVFVAEEVKGVGDKVLGNTTTVDLWTLLEAFLNMSLRSACFSAKIFGLGTIFLNC
jgi:hypothetical protein